MHLRPPVLGSAVALIVAATVGGTVGAVSAQAAPQQPALPGNSYLVHNQFADQPGVAAHQDSALVNPWGLAQAPFGPLWVADNGTDVSTLYTPNFKWPLTVTIPGGAPTGQVYNPTFGFRVSTPRGQKPALFIYSSEAGVISGWSAASGTMAVQASKNDGAIYKGLAISTTGGPARIYATDFHNGRVATWDSSWNPVNALFRDPHLPARYAPFGIQALGNNILVSYAKQDADREDDVPGMGHGYLDLFNRNGVFLHRVASKGPLNSPWGIDVAPANFGAFSGDVLVGNFGNGLIHAYSPTTGAFLGTLKDKDGHPIILDGLWGLLNGNGLSAPKNAVLFSAGPVKESHGLLGFLTAN
jgi:uncharacterized protein (TIGR03118 family)